jgi:hypothetical protein
VVAVLAAIVRDDSVVWYPAAAATSRYRPAAGASSSNAPLRSLVAVEKMAAGAVGAPAVGAPAAGAPADVGLRVASGADSSVRLAPAIGAPLEPSRTSPLTTAVADGAAAVKTGATMTGAAFAELPSGAVIAAVTTDAANANAKCT